LNSLPRQNVELTEQVETRAVAFIILAGAAVRVLSFFYSTNTGGDASARVALTAAWLEHPDWRVIFDSYPPGHFWLIGAFALLIHNVTLAGRLLSLLLGIGSLFVLWKLARLVYGSAAALFSLVIFSLYSMHIAYSTTSSSEVSYLFFMLFSAWLLFSYLRQEAGALWKLAASGILISISESIRFEAWIIFLGLSLLLVADIWNKWDRKQRFRVSQLFPLAVFGIAGGIWPAFMMWYCQRTFGDPMYLIDWTQVRVQHVLATNHSPRAYELLLMPGVLLLTLSPLALAAALYGLVNSWTLPLQRSFAALVLFFFAVQNYQLFKGATVAVARYTLTMGSLLAILAGFGFDVLLRKMAPNRLRLAALALFVFMMANGLVILALSEVPNRYADKFASVSPRLRYPTRVAEVGAYLKAHTSSEDAVVMDDYNAESIVLADASGIPMLSERAYQESRRNEITALQYIHTRHPRFLVYSSQGALRSTLLLPESCSQDAAVEGVSFHCVLANQIYRIYQLSY